MYVISLIAWTLLTEIQGNAEAFMYKSSKIRSTSVAYRVKSNLRTRRVPSVKQERGEVETRFSNKNFGIQM